MDGNINFKSTNKKIYENFVLNNRNPSSIEFIWLCHLKVKHIYGERNIVEIEANSECWWCDSALKSYTTFQNGGNTWIMLIIRKNSIIHKILLIALLIYTINWMIFASFDSADISAFINIKNHLVKNEIIESSEKSIQIRNIDYILMFRLSVSVFNNNRKTNYSILFQFNFLFILYFYL